MADDFPLLDSDLAAQDRPYDTYLLREQNRQAEFIAKHRRVHATYRSFAGDGTGDYTLHRPWCSPVRVAFHQAFLPLREDAQKVRARVHLRTSHTVEDNEPGSGETTAVKLELIGLGTSTETTVDTAGEWVEETIELDISGRDGMGLFRLRTWSTTGRTQVDSFTGTSAEIRRWGLIVPTGAIWSGTAWSSADPALCMSHVVFSSAEGLDDQTFGHIRPWSSGSRVYTWPLPVTDPVIEDPVDSIFLEAAPYLQCRHIEWEIEHGS